MIKVTLFGRMATDVEVEQIGDNKVANFRLASNKKKRGGENVVSFVSAKAWGNLANLFEQFCPKGRQVIAMGDLEQQTWNDKDGNMQSRYTLTVRDVELVGRRNDEEEMEEDKSNNDEI